MEIFILFESAIALFYGRGATLEECNNFTILDLDQKGRLRGDDLNFFKDI